MGKIYFHYNSRGFRVRKAQFIKQELIGIFKSERKKFARVDYIFCDDEFLIGINRNFLKHDFYTDIITFELGNQQICGEIYISVEMTKHNAKKFNVSGEDELHRVMAHGILHLCGYNDKTGQQKIIMSTMENAFLAKIKSRST